jgi:hypothetical protein
VDGDEASGQSEPLRPEELAARIEDLRRREPKTFRLLMIAELGVDPDTGDDVGWNARMKAFDQLERIRDLRAEIPVDRDEAIERVELAGSPHREHRRAAGVSGLGGKAERSRPGRRASSTPAVRTERGWEQLGNDTTAIRAFLVGRAGEQGRELLELAAPFARGRLPADELERRDLLAAVVTEARDRGATLRAIGLVLERPRQRVADLEQRGRTLAAGGKTGHIPGCS